MKIGAVILAAGIGIEDGEIRKFLEMSRPTIFEYMIVNYQRAGVTDIVMVTQGKLSEEIEQSLLRRGVTFLNVALKSYGAALQKGLSYLSGQCDRIFIGDIRFPFFRPETVDMLQSKSGDLLGVMHEGVPGRLMCVSSACAKAICEESEVESESFWKNVEYQVTYIETDDAGIIEKVTTTQEYKERRTAFAQKQIRGSVKVSLAVNRSFFGPGVVTLLTQIDRLGSVREACTKTGMSYSKGWKLIHTAEEETGWKIVERMPGGRNGGEAYITERGRILLYKYELYRERVEVAAQEIYKDIFLDGELS